jgi:hypothetical protein
VRRGTAGWIVAFPELATAACFAILLLPDASDRFRSGGAANVLVHLARNLRIACGVSTTGSILSSCAENLT